MAEHIGQQLGNYRLSRLLGEGGFARVYLGEHIHLGTQAAIKVLHTRLDSDDVERFRAEARTIARLVHPHIIRVLDFGVEDKTPFLVMDYAPNGTLRQKHAKGTQVPLATVVSYVKQVADALQYAHNEKLIHRDVKPENMLQGRRRDILLGDFGIALVAQSSRYQTAQDIAGTIAYMAPEQIQGKPRPASDQYALAVVAYEWLSGERPFHGSFTEIAVQHTITPPQPLGQRIAIPAEVERVVMTALAKEPGERFKSVEAFARALEHASQAGTTPIEVNATEIVKRPASTTFPPAMQVGSAVSPSQPTSSKAPETRSRREKNLHSIYKGHNGRVNAVAWSPDGVRVASCSNDQTVQIWVGATTEKLLAYSGPGNVVAVSWSPDGKWIASSGGDQVVRVCDATTGEDILTIPERVSPITAIAWSPDARYIAFGNRDALIAIWSIGTKSEVATWQCRQNLFDVLINLKSEVNALAWSPQIGATLRKGTGGQQITVGSQIASGSADGLVRIWDMTKEGHYVGYGHLGSVDAVQWSPDARYLASAGTDSEVQIRDASTRKKILTYSGHANSISGLAWRPDGQQIASAGGKTVQVWKVTPGSQSKIQQAPLFTYHHSATVRTVAWSPDGKYLAAGGDDKEVTIWIAPL